MFKRFIFLCALAILFSQSVVLLNSVAHAQTTCNFPYSEPIEGEIAVVGQAVDSDRERFKVLNAFNGRETTVGGGLANLNASLVRDYDKIYHETYLKKGGSFSIGPFSFGKSREFTTIVTKEKYAATFMLTFEVTLPNGKWEIDSSSGSPLTAYAKTLVSDPCKFKQIFGDSFIFQTQRGARVYVAVNVAFSSDKNYSEFKSGMDASVEGKFDGFTKTLCLDGVAKAFSIPAFDFKASFESAQSNISESTRKDGKVEIIAMQIGGDASRLGQIFGTGGDVPIATCGLDNLADCDVAFGNVLAYLGTEEFADGVRNYPETISYLNRSYWEVDPSITAVPEVTPEITTARNQLAENLLERIQDLRTINDSLATSLTDGHREQLESLKDELEDDIDHLTTAGFTCFSNLQSCVQTAEQTLADLKAYNREVINPNPADGRMAYFPFDAEYQDDQVITNSYPFAARLYIHINYQNGWGVNAPERVFKDTPQLWLDNNASSVTVAPNCKVILFDGANFTGQSVTLGSYPDFTWIGWNDRPSSAKLNCPQSTAITSDLTRQFKGALYDTEGILNRFGVDNSAYHLSGSSLIDFPENLISDNMTINAWVKPDNNNNSLIVGRISDNWDYQYAIGQKSGNVYFAIRRTDNDCQKKDGWYEISAGYPLSLNEWSFVTGTWDGNTLKIYINGELQASRIDIPSGGINDCQSGSTRVGYWFDQNPLYFVGSIDDLSFYDRALSDAEIRQLYTAINYTVNQPPLAIFTTSAFTGNAPLTVNLDASDSSDADGSITGYNWQSSAGQNASGSATSMNFTNPGEYSITLTVTDNQGATSQAVKNITVSSSTSPQKGYLQVAITPADVLTAGAQWCVSGSCYNSGAKAELSAGTYTVEFKTVSGWTKPSNQSVTITGGQTKTLTGTYSEFQPGDSFVSRTLSCYIAGNKLTVSLNTSPASATSSYAVQDTPPSGWTVSNISNSGTYDAVNNQVKYGPFFDNTARTLTYEVTPPSDETGDKSFSGLASADGKSAGISGDLTISECANNHPADTDSNFVISIDEVTAYGSAWKKGTSWNIPPNPIPIDYLTRAGAIWKKGESYKYDANAGNCPLCWINTNAAKTSRRASDSSAVSDMPANFNPGEAFTVSITITPADTISAYAVEDSVPAGWSVSSVSDSGEFDTVNNKVKYGPFFDNQTRTLTYQITPSVTASGSFSFNGAASFDGVSVQITGDRTILKEGTEIIPGDANLDGKLDMQDVIYILQVITGIRK